MTKFSDYFNDWLYAKDGYYSNFKEIGKKGDFYTAVSVSKFFGGTIAKRIIASIDEGFLDKDTLIVEIGAHKGYLIADIVEFINTLRPDLLKSLKFGIVERFEALKKIQQEYLFGEFGDVVEFEFFDNINQIKHQSLFFIANEIFDAFGCEIINNDKMLFVDNHRLIWQDMDIDTIYLATKYNIKKGEIANYYDFAKQLADIKKFEFISFDYGDKFPRGDISTRIYEEHKVYPLFEENLNLEKLYKNSDLTYDVNFEVLIGEFKKANIELIEYKTQLSALINFGILDLLKILKDKKGFDIYKKELDKIKILIDPSNMGERFKMVRFRKS